MNTHKNPSTPSTEQSLADHVSNLKFEHLSEHTCERIATFVADTLSVGVAGTAVPEAEYLLNTLAAQPQSATTAVWGAGQCLSAPNAIMANAFNVHCQEFDGVHEGAVVHAMATLLPVLMAEAADRHAHHRPVSGPELMVAIAAGIDVACTLGLAATTAMRFFRPATAGGFGAVAGLARLRKFNTEALIAAWGFQLAQASGTMQGHREGRPVLPLQVSFNARAAWQSCELAQSGLASLTEPIGGECGYLALFEEAHNIAPLLPTLGQTWRIDEFSHKPYPSGRATHAAVEGLLNLMQTHHISSEAIDSVVVTGPSLVNRLVNRPAKRHPSPNDARLCMPYVLAKIMQHGELRPSHYWSDALSDPDTHELAKKVHMAVDDNPNPNALTPVQISVTLNDGTRFETQVDHMLASPQRPLSLAQCQEKFLQCCALGKAPPSQPCTLFARIMDLKSVADVTSCIP